jgi:hypothetical protein
VTLRSISLNQTSASAKDRTSNQQELKKEKKRKGTQRTKADLHTTPRVLETGEKKGFLLTWRGEATEERLGDENEKLQFLPRRQTSLRGLNRWGDVEDWMPRERGGGLAAGVCCGRAGGAGLAGWGGGRWTRAERPSGCGNRGGDPADAGRQVNRWQSISFFPFTKTNY